jgi:dodecin
VRLAAVRWYCRSAPARRATATELDREAGMDDHVYRVIQIVGSSEKSIDDAIHVAIARASKTLRELRWFEVVETRGHIDNGKVHHFQVTLKVGFTID